MSVVLKVIELRQSGSGEVRLQDPTAVVLNYPALDFNFTSWMTNEHLRVLRTEQQSSSSSMVGMAEQKDHLKHAVSGCVLNGCGLIEEWTEPA